VEADFWKQRWAEGKIAFHQGVANEYLVEHGSRLTGRVLVPLCGKTEDLAYLASRGHEVIGVELVEEAVAAFFREHGITPTVDEPWSESTHRAYHHGGITVIAGDWFSVTREMVGAIDSVYDRAALVAMPPEMRVAYVAQLQTLVDRGTHGLLVTVAYDQGNFAGPPFSVEDDEVRAHFSNVEQLTETSTPGGRLGDANIGAVERSYAVTI
jgi:thiopurine S-methyltransferase